MTIDMIRKLSIVVLILAVPAVAQTTLTLDEAVRTALERRPELKAAVCCARPEANRSH